MSFTRLAFLAASLMLANASVRAEPLPEVKPAEVGLDASRLDAIKGAVAEAIEKKQVPGAVIMVTRHGKIAYLVVAGQKVVEPTPEPLTRDTMFDLASLTKPISTATSIMILVDQGRLHLDDTLAKLLPEFDNHGKGAITLEQLLRHRTGLIADNPIGDFKDGPAEAWKKIAELDLLSNPGEKFLYSDVNFMILGKIVERVSGSPLDEFAAAHIFKPLGIEARFLPTDPARAAPTEKFQGALLRGVVHDPRARALGGVAGHAGLFGTADDIAIYAQMILDLGKTRDGQVILKPETVRAMTDAADTPARQRRGLGWDVDTPFSSLRGQRFGPRSFGHTGFTGTSLWIDPETDMAVVILSSRLHPDGRAASPSKLRGQVATIAAESITDRPAPPTPVVESSEGPVDTGLDVLVKQGFAPLKGKRVGLVTNHTGLDKTGKAAIDLLFAAPDVRLVKLFSPEHGIRGLLDKENVGDSRDEKTGLPIHSLYHGKTRKPSAEQLEGLDVLVYDIQDIGVRYYTYISTLGLVLEAAREKGLAVMVLDRPNPIGGLAVSGPVRDPDLASFIAYHELPVRHGMTVGELARLYNTERKIGAGLTVIPCEGWHRGDLYDKTGLLWVNPSPNMRSLTEALIYPGIGLLEATNLATGRGTDTPFERVGAPWIDPRAFASYLNAQNIPGARFLPVRFSPKERQYAGQDCGGVLISISDWSRFDPVHLGISFAAALHHMYPKEWKPEGMLKLMTDRATQMALIEGKSAVEIERLWEAELEAFKAVRVKYLLYP
ncbi:exo-beta-N-acetylmuramidase NamZ domain-containing protein [Singulisphaera sp. PoT]|uniref:exo-beta-N-acetylmuramidase NamZ domain-containing protein n=1 Tax=Singulisphaera sp. PoT TaxID=3411797 RepID=UPI003BF48B80